MVFLPDYYTEYYPDQSGLINIKPWLAIYPGKYYSQNSRIGSYLVDPVFIKICWVALFFQQFVSFCCHDGIIDRQFVDHMCPPVYGHNAPLNEDGRVMVFHISHECDLLCDLSPREILEREFLDQA